MIDCDYKMIDQMSSKILRHNPQWCSVVNHLFTSSIISSAITISIFPTTVNHYDRKKNCGDRLVGFTNNI
uniref:Uncharacterized protein n=1 Tax=Romanomermis culicivorax TaxID=13658 RepID=A0A915I5J5_ROMCU